MLHSESSSKDHILSHDSTIWSAEGCCIVRTRFDSHHYKTSCDIRSSAYAIKSLSVETDCDKLSDIYILFKDGYGVATVGGTLCSLGTPDCNEFYPRKLLSLFSSRVLCPYRLAVRPEVAGGGRFFSRTILQEGWRDQISKGARIMIMSAHRPMLPYYFRLGFRVVDGFDFTHPVLGTDSVVLALASSQDPIGLQCYLSAVDRQVCFEEISEFCGLKFINKGSCHER